MSDKDAPMPGIARVADKTQDALGLFHAEIVGEFIEDDQFTFEVDRPGNRNRVSPRCTRSSRLRSSGTTVHFAGTDRRLSQRLGAWASRSLGSARRLATACFSSHYSYGSRGLRRDSGLRRGYERIPVFSFRPTIFPVKPIPQPLSPTLCRPNTSGSAYFGKSRGNQNRRLSHSESVSAVPILLFSRGNGRAFPIDSGRVATGAHVPRRREHRCGMASLAMSTPHFGFAWQRGAAAFYRENRKSTKRPSVAKINPTLDLAFRI